MKNSKLKYMLSALSMIVLTTSMTFANTNNLKKGDINIKIEENKVLVEENWDLKGNEEDIFRIIPLKNAYISNIEMHSTYPSEENLSYLVEKIKVDGNDSTKIKINEDFKKNRDYEITIKYSIDKNKKTTKSYIRKLPGALISGSDDTIGKLKVNVTSSDEKYKKISKEYTNISYSKLNEPYFKKDSNILKKLSIVGIIVVAGIGVTSFSRRQAMLKKKSFRRKKQN